MIWGGDSIKIVWRGHVKKIIPKYMILKTSGVNWGDLGTFWSDFRMQNHTVYVYCVITQLNRVNQSINQCLFI